jgi:YesN/AraC family two-component response regulator
MSRQMLEVCGYHIIEARNGAEALSICESENLKIDLLLTDVVMPLVGGRELAARLAEKYPRLRLLYTSGYTDDAIIRRGIITEDMNFMQKPFTLRRTDQENQGIGW